MHTGTFAVTFEWLKQALCLPDQFTIYNAQIDMRPDHPKQVVFSVVDESGEWLPDIPEGEARDYVLYFTTNKGVTKLTEVRKL